MIITVSFENEDTWLGTDDLEDDCINRLGSRVT
jgi:hypothetical protein